MHVTRLADAAPYDAPGHDAMHMLRLQGKDASPAKSMWAALSYLLPGGGTTLKGSDKEKLYVVVEGDVTISNGDEDVVLGPLDSCLIERGEQRQLRNDTNRSAAILLVMEA